MPFRAGIDCRAMRRASKEIDTDDEARSIRVRDNIPFVLKRGQFHVSRNQGLQHTGVEKVRDFFSFVVPLPMSLVDELSQPKR